MSKQPRLERALVELGPRLELPPTPDLVRRVRAVIESQDAPPARRGPLTWRAGLVGVAVIAVIVATTLVFSPAARHAVADWLGIGGIRIGHGAGPTASAPPGSNLALGTPTTLEEARARVDFTVRVPLAAGEPDAVYAADVPVGGRVTLVYAAGDGLPNTDETGLGMIVTEFRATLTEEIGKKTIEGGGVEVTDVDGALAYWISGPHTIYLYKDAEGNVREDSVRLSGNALIWVEDGITYRIESDLDRVGAVRIAESMS